MANEFIEWLAGLDRTFVFLLLLPFVVAAVGVWSWWVGQEDIDREYDEARGRDAQAAERRRGERRQGERRRSGGIPT